MPRDIFTDVTRPPARLGSQAWYTVPASIFTHAAIVAILVIIPLVVNDVMPMPSPSMILVAAPPPPPPPPEPSAPRPTTQKAVPAAPPDPTKAPFVMPDKIAEEVPIPHIPPGVAVTEGPGVAQLGTIGGVTDGVRLPDPPAPTVVKPVRPGGKVKYPEKIRDVRPIYPQIAILNKVEGTVMIEAMIGVDGRVKDARVFRSVPLLDRAALDAVNQWIFSPTLLNEVPVPVIITITVAFKLQ